MEEFHAKLQQIGVDNTKGMIITYNGCFQRSTLNYVNFKGIALARIIPFNLVKYVFFNIEKDYVMINNSYADNRKRLHILSFFFGRRLYFW